MKIAAQQSCLLSRLLFCEARSRHVPQHSTAGFSAKLAAVNCQDKKSEIAVVNAWPSCSRFSINSPVYIVHREGVSSMMSTSDSRGTVLLDPAHRVNLRARFAVDWSNWELEVLKQGLVRYANEPNILKYIKIAAILHDKTVRDVAMRCRWMTENASRCKPDNFTGKKTKDRKDKLIGSSMSNMQSSEPGSFAAYSLKTNDVNQNILFSREATTVIDNKIRQLLDDNVKLLHQIAVNLKYDEIQYNTVLLFQSKENIAAILNSLSETPGIMSRMPPLPVHINEDLFQVLLPFH